jgi:hypothetical protein
MFCAPGLVFDRNVCVGSRFHVLRARTRFRRYRGHQVPFSCFSRSGSFWAVSMALGPVFMFCASGLFFGGAEFVGSRFHVLRTRTRFRRYGGRLVPFLCFSLPNSFSAITRALGPVFMFCAPGLVFSGTVVVGSCFHILRGRTHFLRYRWRRVPFSCFPLPESFSTVPRV